MPHSGKKCKRGKTGPRGPPGLTGPPGPGPAATFMIPYASGQNEMVIPVNNAFDPQQTAITFGTHYPIPNYDSIQAYGSGFKPPFDLNVENMTASFVFSEDIPPFPGTLNLYVSLSWITSNQFPSGGSSDVPLYLLPQLTGSVAAGTVVSRDIPVIPPKLMTKNATATLIFMAFVENTSEPYSFTVKGYLTGSVVLSKA